MGLHPFCKPLKICKMNTKTTTNQVPLSLNSSFASVTYWLPQPVSSRVYSPPWFLSVIHMPQPSSQRVAILQLWKLILSSSSPCTRNSSLSFANSICKPSNLRGPTPRPFPWHICVLVEWWPVFHSPSPPYLHHKAPSTAGAGTSLLCFCVPHAKHRAWRRTSTQQMLAK